MKIKQFLLYCCIFAFLFCSCDIQIGGGSDSGTINNPTDVPSRKFWAQNLVTGNFYQVDADLLAQSKNCSVWADKEAGVSIATANSMAKAYEDNILPKMLDTFGIQVKDQNGVVWNTMELADYIGDEDGKLCILLLDIRDGYSPGTSWVAGYFWDGNFYDTNTYRTSNECDMIYIDTYPSKPGTADSNATFAHEMQHMMNSVTSRLIRHDDKYFYPMDLWIDEGLSTTAEWLIMGSHPIDRWLWYNQDPSGLIRKGNNFFVWGNRESEDQEALMDDYATTYLFFQWLRLQAGSKDIYYDIITSGNYDYKAVTSAANKYMTGMNYDDWGTLLKNWLAANYINAPSGPYGYKNDSVLKNVKANTAPDGVTSVYLAPGEGVYSITDDYQLPGSKQSVRYAGLDKFGNALSDTKTFSGGAMLTYNANTNNIKGGLESGTTTGVAASYTEADASGRSVAGASFSGSYAIGPWDMLRRNGLERPSSGNEFSENKFSFELTKPIKGIKILE